MMLRSLFISSTVYSSTQCLFLFLTDLICINDIFIWPFSFLALLTFSCSLPTPLQRKRARPGLRHVYSLCKYRLPWREEQDARRTPAIREEGRVPATNLRPHALGRLERQEREMEHRSHPNPSTQEAASSVGTSRGYRQRKTRRGEAPPPRQGGRTVQREGTRTLLTEANLETPRGPREVQQGGHGLRFATTGRTRVAGEEDSDDVTDTHPGLPKTPPSYKNK